MTSLVYETIPYRYSPLLLSSSSPCDAYDNFDTLTRSMQDLTSYADLIARALAADSARPSAADKTRKKSSPDTASNDPKPPPAAAQALRLLLRPRIDWRETADGFVLTAATPGLRKDELQVDVLDATDGAYIEIAGKSAEARDSHSTQATDADKPAAASQGHVILGRPGKSRSNRIRLMAPDHKCSALTDQRHLCQWSAMQVGPASARGPEAGPGMGQGVTVAERGTGAENSPKPRRRLLL